MKIDGEFLASHMAYSRWATLHLIAAAREEPDSDLRKDLGNSFGGVLGTLTHIFAADRIWLSRLTGSPRMTLLDAGEDLALHELESAWPAIYDGFTAYLRTADVFSVLEYRNLQGKTCRLPVWQVVLHVVNHATYHRGQVTTMLRQLGAKPVSTDLVCYYLDQANAAKA